MPAHADWELLQAYLDGTLDAACCVGVAERLKCEPSLADELVRLSREDSINTEWVRSSAIAAATPSERNPIERKSRRWRYAIIAATIASCAAILAILASWSGRPDPRNGDLVLAMLEDVQGVVEVVSAEGNVNSARNGQPLYSGQEIRTGEDGSSTVVRVKDARLVMAAETRIRLTPETSENDSGWPWFFLSEGMVSAEFAGPDANPMVLHSKDMEVRGGAGKYSFVSLPDATVIETDDGAAHVTRKSDRKSIDVLRGQSATTASNEPFQAKDLAARMTSPKRAFQDSAPVFGLLFDLDGKNLTSSAADAIKRWNLDSGKSTAVVRAQKKKPFKMIATAADGKLAAVSQNDNQIVKVLDLATGTERASQKGLKRAVAVAMSPDSSQLAISWTAGKEGHEVRLYDTALGIERVLHTENGGAAHCMAFSPKGGLLATGAARNVKIWDALSGNLIRAITKMPNEPRSLAFSPDGRFLAIGARNGAIQVIDAHTASVKVVLSGHLRDVGTLAFSPDGQMLASGAADGTAKLWNISNGREITTIKAHGNAVNSVAFSPDGRTLATSGSDKKIMIWDVPVVGWE